ncbi:hypothetical protein NDK50_35095 [Paraburkholderia bryophila]|uniref:helix-turn-helix transcriptional regulator n=1 Tax=Paraburkholderia bryophila TaxID=420952 RepID=UPI00234BDF6C|nr:hypothetical protein [Paraburkholderia bryophila]WCM23179.1 hypothetical protein NDK50_35095 [Paraburkholderia bryophila]
MQPSESLAVLKSLPADSPLTATHIAALLETLRPILRQPVPVDLDSLPNSKLIDETMLAEWLGESVSSLQKWRVSGNGPRFVKNPKSVRYRVGDVRDWISHNTVQSTSEATTRLSRFGDMWDGFDDPVPAIIVNHVPMGFFRSLDTIEEPSGYAWVAAERSNPATFQDALTNSLTGQFAYLLEADCEAASRLADTRPEVLDGFRPEEWVFNRFYPQLPGAELAGLLPAFRFFVGNGLNLNAATRFRIGEQTVTASIPHLLTAVKTDGQDDGNTFTAFMVELLRAGLDVDMPDEGGRSALQVALDIGFNLYPKCVNSYRLNRKLSGELLSDKDELEEDGGKL